MQNIALRKPPQVPRQLVERRREIERLTAGGRFEEAKSQLKELLEDGNDPVFALNKLGIIAAREGNLPQAREFFEKCLAVDPRSASAYSNLGNIYQEEGNFDQAIACYEKAIDIDPDYATAYHNLGVAYKRKGDLNKSVNYLKRAARLERTSVSRQWRGQAPGHRSRSSLIGVTIVIITVLYLLLTR